MDYYKPTLKTRTTRTVYEMTDEWGKPAGKVQVVRVDAWYRSCDGLGGRWMKESEREEPA